MKMSNFNNALQSVLVNEGSYVNDPDDPGGETYKGIARRRNHNWSGWVTIDLAKLQNNFPKNLEKNTILQGLIETLYRELYWNKILGDDIFSSEIASVMFDFAVNAGPRTSIKLAQIAIGAEPDGVMGPKTLLKLNEVESEVFLPTFIVARIARYATICKKRPTSRKYFFGWVLRALGEH